MNNIALPQIIDRRKERSKSARPILAACVVGLANRLIGKEMDAIVGHLFRTGDLAENLSSITEGEVEKGATTVKDEVRELTFRSRKLVSS
jgi:hypothetical protein